MTSRQSRRRPAAALLSAAAFWFYCAADHSGAQAQGLPSANPPPMPGARLFSLPPTQPADPARLSALLANAQAAMRAGDAPAAQAAYEQASALQHTATIEAGWVRAQMLAGEYRQALAFAAHTAGAHPFDGNGIALYGWLLHVGGQPALAKALLTSAAKRLPNDAAIAHTLNRVQNPSAPADAVHDANAAPPPHGAPVDAQAVPVGSGVLVDGGRKALVPSAWLEDTGRVWLRDGLGRTWPAAVLRRDAALGLTLLALDAPDAPGASPAAAPRDAFPGSPALVLSYPGAPAAHHPQWPVMTLGFMGMPSKDAARRSLTFEMPAREAGGPVFDVSGRWIGLTVPAESGGTRVIAASEARSFVEAQSAEHGEPAKPLASSEVGPAARLPMDQVYEMALRTAVQVLVSPP